MFKKCLIKFSAFDNGVPSYHTIRRAFLVLDPKEFRKAFSKRMNDCQKITHAAIIAFDGNCLRSSYKQADKKPIKI
ncbi:MAG: transposase family protein [Psychromonas sp.]|nr:transposase family protein [Psychromonas sp.]